MILETTEGDVLVWAGRYVYRPAGGDEGRVGRRRSQDIVVRDAIGIDLPGLCDTLLRAAEIGGLGITALAGSSLAVAVGRFI